MRDHIDFETQLINNLNLPYQLRPYQWEGIRFLVENDAVL